jgi:hypothetical protein
MISEVEHEKILVRLSGVKPRFYQKHYNPNFPLAKLGSCGECGAICKITGSISTNKQRREYPRYLCRVCRKTFAKDPIHDSYKELLQRTYVRPDLAEKFMSAIIRVWNKNNAGRLTQLKAIDNQIKTLEVTMSDVATAYTESKSPAMRESLENQQEQLQKQKLELQDRYNAMSDIDADIDKFARFVADFMSNLPRNWLELDPLTRETCQKLVFSGELLLHKDGKVSTTKLSSIYRLLTIKKDTEVPSISYMVMPPSFARKGQAKVTLREIINYHAYDDAWVPDMLAGKARQARISLTAIYWVTIRKLALLKFLRRPAGPRRSLIIRSALSIARLETTKLGNISGRSICFAVCGRMTSPKS